MSKRKNKIDELLARINKLKGLPDNEISGLADSILREEMKTATDSIRGNAQVKMLEKISQKLEQFKKDFDLTPVSEEVNVLREEIGNLQKEFSNYFSAYDESVAQQLTSLKKAIALVRDDASKETDAKSGEITSLLEKFKSEIESAAGKLYSEGEARFSDSFKGVEARFSSFENQFLSQLSQSGKKTTDSIAEVRKELSDKAETTRLELLNRIANTGGGNANRQININSSVMSRKYTDINFLNTSSIGWTATNDETNKQVIIRASVLSGGGGGSALTVKEADGSPSVSNVNTIVVSNGTLTDDGGGQVTVTTGGGGGGLTRTTSVISVSSTLAAAASTDYVIFPNVGVQITLPTAINNSNLYTIKNFSASSILVTTSAGQTIDGSATALMPTQNESLSFISSGSVWGVV